jgi:hypothetical protein
MSMTPFVKSEWQFIYVTKVLHAATLLRYWEFRANDALA